MNLKKFLVMLILVIGHLDLKAQYYFGGVSPVLGAEYDSRSSFSLKAGVSAGFLKRNEWFRAYYTQLMGKYNFTNKSIGGQFSVGYCSFLGGRLGIDYERNVNTGNDTKMIFALFGLDIFGAMGLQLGPKFDFTSDVKRRTHLMINLDIPIQLLYEKDSREKYSLKGRSNQTNKK